MSTPKFGELPQMNVQNASLEELRAYVGQLQNHLIKLQRDLKYTLETLDYENIFDVGGWRVTPDQLASKDGDVGMSTEDTAADDIRFWAGDAKDGSPKFKVTKGGIATLIEMILSSVASGERVVIDSTGFHSYDSSGIERLTIGTTPAEGAKALIGRDTAGAAQSVYTYATATVDGSSRTGQFITAHGCVVIMDSSGSVRMLDAGAGGFRALGVGNRPQISTNGLSWNDIAYKSEVDAKATSGASTGSAGGHNHGVTPGRYLMTYDSAGVELGLELWVAASDHSHTQT